MTQPVMEFISLEDLVTDTLETHVSGARVDPVTRDLICGCGEVASFRDTAAETSSRMSVHMGAVVAVTIRMYINMVAMPLGEELQKHIAIYATQYDGKGGVAWKDRGGIKCGGCDWEHDPVNGIRPWVEYYAHLVGVMADVAYG